MHRLGLFVVLAVTLLLATLSPAFADHMNGRYVGTGEAEGVSLEITQRGPAITGRFSGADQGTLSGQSDGGDNFQGVATSTSWGQARVSGTWSPQGLQVTFTAQNGSFSYLFVPEGSQTTTNESSGNLAGGQYYYSNAGSQTGPILFEELQGLITAGTVTRSTLIWTPGQAEWQRADSIEALADLFPPEPPPVDEYYTVANGERIGPLTLDALIARIEAGETEGSDLVWKTGLEEWTAASSFEELSAALSGPPDLPEAPPEVPEDQQRGGPPAIPNAEEPPATPGSGGPPSAPGGEAPAEATN